MSSLHSVTGHLPRVNQWNSIIKSHTLTHFNIRGISVHHPLPLTQTLLSSTPHFVTPLTPLNFLEQDCSWTFNTSTGPGEIRSMNYPDTYPPKLDCISIIVAKAGQVIHHSFPQKDDQLRLFVFQNSSKYDCYPVISGCAIVV